MRMKKWIAFALASAMALSVAACGSTATTGDNNNKGGAVSYPGTPDADMVTVDLRAEPPELNSILTTDVASGDILREVIAGLYKLDANDNPVEDLATDTQVSEDGKTYTMKLREDAKWSNGEPVTAHDFVFAYQTICKKETASTYGFIVYENLENGVDVFEGKKDPSELGVKAIDDYTLEVKFTTPIPYAKHLFAFASYYPMNQKAYEEIGADKYAKDADKIVTNGAYTIAEWTHDDHITLQKNPDYYNADEIKIEKIKFLMMKDANARMNAFKAGEVDGIDLTGEQVEQLNKEGVETKSYVDNGVWYLQYNTKKAGLNNAKIRQALGLAVDTKSLCDNVLKDGSIPATGLVPTGIAGTNGSKYRDTAGDMISYDLEQAKKLLEEGLKEEGLTASDLKLSIIVDDTTKAQKEATYYQEQWKQALGLSIDVKPMPFKSRLQAMNDGDFDIVFAGWAPDYNDPMTFLDLFVTTNGNNYGKFSNEQYDKLIEQAKNEVDVEKRQELLIEAEKLLVSTEAPVSPLYFSTKPYVLSSKVQNVTKTGFQEWDFTDGAELVTK